MKIRNFLHKGLRRLYEDDNAKGVPSAAADKLRKMLFVLENLRSPEQLQTLGAWKAHQLTGSRKGVWSLHVTANWRLTFWIDADEPALCDLNLEDYH